MTRASRTKLIRHTRATRFLPKMRGVGQIVWPLQAIYKPFMDPQQLYRIDNFDGDLFLDVRPTDTIGAALWHIPQLWERRERKLFCSAIIPGCTVLDVGANIGIYTLLAVKRAARVFASKPTRRMTRCFKRKETVGRAHVPGPDLFPGWALRKGRMTSRFFEVPDLFLEYPAVGFHWILKGSNERVRRVVLLALVGFSSCLWGSGCGG